ncbi:MULTISPECIES: nicotinate phosphoribosyltransferase [Providencia]|uniref:nicotinate phosphoribosyltransferase n=1 Tax=Providencia TaxID=586 RepID=UPI0003E2BEF4|nr:MULTISPECIES: nicotinate phosphoribosyltransferase [Providencia]ETT00779.1 nicotinate phosphoribosyltransferase [Providencia alcalifaciens PAL-3]EUD00116.1 nicotinate phosphoribosyltransferase [Providencia alcalifaciens PAL-1]MTB44634.1 nicotinate phosphoribosyltransferase [Providencia sp. wls1950]MTC24860.1 nicotinate phosphoribosyltransferase [Providencia sp. wls1938]MTC46791.1 nicotinate phosphoribosyltransferase [Providencia sp. wls1922]
MNLDVTPIITSLLDTDAYKLHMQQAVFHRYNQVPVVAEFRCRSSDILGAYANEIEQQIQLMAQLSLSDDEYQYLRTLPFFTEDYLSWLKTFRFNPEQVVISVADNGQLAIRISGPWREVIMWEVPLLALVSEIVQRDRHPTITADDAVNQLHKLLELFYQEASERQLNLSGFKLMDFGTRRRFSYKVQAAIVGMLKQEFPYLVGTSNYKLARELGLMPVGTQAHEWFQAHQQISPELANSQREALQSWLDEYPNHLGIALTDCITMDAFLRDFDREFANRYQGLRHDSGDPIEWGEKAIAHYQKLGIDPLSKTLVFSDNLDLQKALELYHYFHKRINLVFGIGTRLTCNIPNVVPMNIVIKLVECNGKPVAKLSDSPGKTICEDDEFVNQLRKAFDLPKMEKAC